MRDVGLPVLFCDPELLSTPEVLIAARGGEPGGEEDEADMVLLWMAKTFVGRDGGEGERCQQLATF